jgi:hypothetical protein
MEEESPGLMFLAVILALAFFALNIKGCKNCEAKGGRWLSESMACVKELE